MDESPAPLDFGCKPFLDEWQVDLSALAHPLALRWSFLYRSIGRVGHSVPRAEDESKSSRILARLDKIFTYALRLAPTLERNFDKENLTN
jgi:hypothetical protein